ncbi:MAG: BamA/TamA family outer membrane protein, partial [Candidatus Latescibacterota bacterium]
PDSSGGGAITTDFVFLSNRTGYANIYRQQIDPDPDGKSADPECIVKGERTAAFESLHLFRSKLGVSQNQRLAFVSKSGEQDALYGWDLKRQIQLFKWVFPELISMSSPSWSPDEKRLVISGLSRRGQSDLFVVDVAEGTLERITEDHYSDRDPDWSPDGEQIAFSSDRLSDGLKGFHNLFVYDMVDKTIRPVTLGAHTDTAPSWSPDGTRIAFSSDRAGAFDLYLCDPSGQKTDGPGRIWPVTKFLTGAFDPDWLPDGKGLVFTAFEGYAFGIYRLELEEDQLDATVALPDSSNRALGWEPEKISGTIAQRAVRYRRRFGLDIAQSQIANDPEVGMSGGVQLAMTDILGDHRYYMMLSSASGHKGEILKNINAALTQVNLSRQMNWAGGLFHLSERLFTRYEGSFQERRYGGYLSLQYPFSKFRRVESSLVLRNSEKEWFSGKRRKALLLSQYVGYTVDTSLWGPVGPIDGWRYNATFGVTLDPRRGGIHYATALVDWRHYLRLSARSGFAVRLLGRSSWGREAQCFYMGGSWTLRGYDRGSLWGRHLALWNNELRFPLIDNLLIRFPFGALGFPALRGALFADMGNAWTDDWDGLLGSFGIGVRMRVADLLVLRFDLAKRMDSRRIGGPTHSEFFFGWSY